MGNTEKMNQKSTKNMSEKTFFAIFATAYF